MGSNRLKSILFVCTGNICRSPLAEGVVRDRLLAAGLHLELDSAGTEDYHVGEPPDPRAIEVGRRAGVDIAALRARQLTREDLDRYDLVLVADRSHLASIRRRFPGARAEVALLLQWCGVDERDELPDPYYGDGRDFDRVLGLLDCAADGLLRRLRERPH